MTTIWAIGKTIHTLYRFTQNYTVENGTVICEKPFYSATELDPSHYHATVKNPKHERLIEIFMTHMPRLNEIMASKSK